MAVTWKVPPTGIGREINRRSHRAQAALGALGASHAARAEAAMKQSAPWQDRTGNARQGLFGTVEVSATNITITLGGTVFYQVFLELGTSRMAARPIIVPIATETMGQFISDATRVIREAFG